MAEIIECKAYSRGEIVPLIFEVFTESGITFSLIPNEAICVIRKTNGSLVEEIPASVIKEEDAIKTLIASWNTSKLSSGYYILQVWVAVNLTGRRDSEGNLIQEAKIASEELKRYIR